MIIFSRVLFILHFGTPTFWKSVQFFQALVKIQSRIYDSEAGDAQWKEFCIWNVMMMFQFRFIFAENILFSNHAWITVLFISQ